MHVKVLRCDWFFVQELKYFVKQHTRASTNLPPFCSWHFKTPFSFLIMFSLDFYRMSYLVVPIHYIPSLVRVMTWHRTEALRGCKSPLRQVCGECDRIAPPSPNVQMLPILPCVMFDLSWKLHENIFIRFSVILLSTQLLFSIRVRVILWCCCYGICIWLMQKTGKSIEITPWITQSGHAPDHLSVNLPKYVCYINYQ